ncbi:type II toxin-antitoxin system HicA family toxin [Afifella sp. IM 167]|uniref:type II toxin-antitoxin system HicA family toxin n=1 Tax=Afifella sp. IM 167 TaxID=2033586 RepID=UPI001CCBCA5B|nr:type II toxin-antitoxin system HicA family toxin [Afifella sp. IM 167]MBZ8133809.1 hypothetical protein [Afifella sp. IM 167]
MARKRSLLARMKANPRADWTIADLQTLCDETGLTITSPGSGSHYKIHSPHLSGILTVPARRPIKPVYVRMLVALCESHLGERGAQE